MIGTCWSSSLMTSLINSAARPVSLLRPAARAFLEVIRVKVGTTTAETPAARVRKERRDGAGRSTCGLGRAARRDRVVRFQIRCAHSESPSRKRG